MDFRRPKKTRLQQALREAERSVSGALFLLFSAATPPVKQELRAKFVAGVCQLLISRKHLTEHQAQQQLSPAQWAALQDLSHQRTSSPSYWGAGHPQELASLGSWLELGSNYVSGRLRGEAEPASVDWGRNEQELRSQLAQFQGEPKIDLREARLRLVHSQEVSAEAVVEVLGSYRESEQSYLAGWADPSLEPGTRPLPVFGCASQLFRLDLTAARSEAHRAAWLGRVNYLLEYKRGDKLYFLGLDKPQALRSSASFQTSDLRPEMQSRLDTLEKALSTREPERLQDLFSALSQEVRRQSSLFQGNPEGAQKVEKTAQILSGLGKGIKTRSLLGSSRSSLSRGEQDELRAELDKLREFWGA